MLLAPVPPVMPEVALVSADFLALLTKLMALLEHIAFHFLLLQAMLVLHLHFVLAQILVLLLHLVLPLLHFLLVVPPRFRRGLAKCSCRTCHQHTYQHHLAHRFTPRFPCPPAELPACG